MKAIASTLLALAISASSLFSQTTDADREADKEALRALGQRYEDAINTWSLTEISESVLPDATAVFMTGEELKGIPAMQAYFDEVKQQLGEDAKYTVELHPDETQFYGDTAVAHGTSKERVELGNGTVLNYETKWTAILLKRNGKWMASRIHVSLDPIDNPIIDLKFAALKWWHLGMGLLGGVIIGWLIAKILGRQSRRAGVEPTT